MSAEPAKIVQFPQRRESEFRERARNERAALRAAEQAGACDLTSTGDEREVGPALASALADFWWQHRFAIAWTVSNVGEEAKIVRESWPRTAKVVHEEPGARAGYVAQRLRTRNPVIVATAEDTSAKRYLLVDVDGPEDEAVYQSYGFPPTLTSASRDPAEKRFHRIFEPPDGADMLRVRFEGGIINLGKNGYLVAPPAIHPSGSKYRYLDRNAPITKLPRELYERLVRESGKQDEESRALLAADPTAKVVPGLRHKRMLQICGALRRYGVTEGSALRTLLEFNAERCEPPKPEEDVRALVRDGYRRWQEVADCEFAHEGPALPGLVKPKRRPALDESGMADHLLRCLNGSALYVEDMKTWIVFKEGRWTAQFATSNVKEACVQVGKRVYVDYGAGIEREQADPLDVAYAEAAEAFANGRYWRSWVDNVTTLAGRRALVDVSELDANPYLLAVGNGVLDLRSYTLREGRPEDMLTVGSTVNYDPDAGCPRWRKFVDEITCKDGGLAAYLQRFAGLLLTGSADEQKFWIWYGPDGGNGKDTFANLLMHVLGEDLAKEMSFATIAQVKQKRSGSEATPDLIALRGARFVKTTEPERREPLNEARIKQITGKSTVAARDNYAKQTNFRPRFKLAILANHRPTLNVTDGGIRRRLAIVPFNAKFDDALGNVNRRMEEELTEEAEGILAWMVEGLKEYDRVGLEPKTCAAVAKATGDFLENANPLRPALEAGYIELDPQAETRGQDLREALNDFFSAHPNERRLADDELSDALAAYGVSGRHTNKGRVWTGIKVSGCCVE